MLKKKLKRLLPFLKVLKREVLPPMPSESEVQSELLEILSSIMLTSDRKTQILSLPIESKWRLINHHKQFLQSNKDDLKYINTQEINILLQKLQGKPTIIDLHDVRRWFLRAKEFEVHTFCIYDGVLHLINRLEDNEIISRSTNNYRKQLELLKLIEIIVKLEFGPEELLKIKDSLYILLCNLHVLHIELTSFVLEILAHMLWNSPDCIEKLMEALFRLQRDRGYLNRFDIFMILLYRSTNIIMIKNLVVFINAMISSHVDDKKRVVLKSEFESCGILKNFEKIKLKIAKNSFKIEDCVYENIQDLLIDIKYNEENNLEFSDFNTDKPIFENTREFPNKEIEKLYNESTNTIDIVLLKDYCYEKFEKSRIDEIKSSQDISTINNYYLTAENLKGFQDCIIALLNQIETFYKLNQEKDSQKANKLKEHLKKNRDSCNIKDLVDQIKENVFERDNYSTFLNILQLLVVIPNTETGDEIWEKLEEQAEFLIENKNIDSKTASKQLSKSIEEYEKKLEELSENLKNKDLEIKKLIESRNFLQKEFNQFKESNNSPIIKVDIPKPPSISIENKVPPPPPPPLGGNAILPPPLGILAGNSAPPPPSLLGIGGPPLPPGLPGIPGNILNNSMKINKKEKKKVKTRLPMRGPQWVGLKYEQTIGTIFENMEEIEIDENSLISLEADFQVKETTKTVTIVVAKPKIEKISLLTPERGKMYDIVFAKLKTLSVETLSNALLTCDKKILSISVLDLLLPIIPKEQEIKDVYNHISDYDKLGVPEKFLIELGKIKGIEFRIRALYFKEIHQELIEDLENKIKEVLKIWGSILEDKKLPLLFKYILSYGNYLNGVSIRGGMFGFKYEGLDKIVECRSTKSSKRNLLIFLLETIEKKNGEKLIDPSFDITIFDRISKLPITQLEADLNELKIGFKCIENAIASQMENDLDCIKNSLEEVNISLKGKIESIEEQIKKINEFYVKVCKYLVEDNKEKQEVVGQRIYKLYYNCVNSQKEIEKQNLFTKKEAERKLREEQKRQLIEEKKKKELKLPIKLKGDNKIATDNLLNNEELVAKNNDTDSILQELAKKREIKIEKTEKNGIKTTMAMNMFTKKMKNKIKLKKNELVAESNIIQQAKEDKLIDKIEKDLIKGLLNHN